MVVLSTFALRTRHHSSVLVWTTSTFTISIEDLASDDFRCQLPRFQSDNFQENLDVLERVKKIADAKGVTPGQLALARVLAQGEDIVPIPGTTQRTHLEENVGGASIRLTLSELADIADAMPPDAAAGPRYSEAG